MSLDSFIKQRTVNVCNILLNYMYLPEVTNKILIMFKLGECTEPSGNYRENSVIQRESLAISAALVPFDVASIASLWSGRFIEQVLRRQLNSRPLSKTLDVPHSVYNIFKYSTYSTKYFEDTNKIYVDFSFFSEIASTCLIFQGWNLLSVLCNIVFIE